MPGTSEFCEALGRANTRCLVTLVSLRAVSASGHFSKWHDSPFIQTKGFASACCIVSQALYDTLQCLATATPVSSAAVLTATARAASAALTNGIGSIDRNGNGQQRRVAVFTSYIRTCFLMSLVQPCCSSGLLAGLGADDMTVECKLCTGLHVYV